MEKKNLIVGQSGGPTAVINSSLYGVVSEGIKQEEIGHVYGMINGIEGFLKGTILDFEEALPGEKLEYLTYTPGAYLGSCRYKIADPEKDDTDYRRILEVFKKHNVRYFFYNGGNDSMDTCNKISKYMQKVGYECRVMGVPKTIDNDLFGTDHCPGYGSAAKFIATSCMEVGKDTDVYNTDMVTVIEIMGRHAGWLTASAALATEYGNGCGPDLIYLPERDFDLDQFTEDVTKIMKQKRNVLVAVSEGLHYADGSFVSEAKTSGTDGFGHAQLGGLAVKLANYLKERMGLKKVRGIELSLLQRSAAHIASAVDIDEAYSVGKYAVEAAINGATGQMVALEREDNQGLYSCKPTLLSLSSVANYEKKVPLEWITRDGNYVTNEFINYVLPLIQGEPRIPQSNSLPRYARLKKVKAKPCEKEATE